MYLKETKREIEEKLNHSEGVLQELNDMDKNEVFRNTSKILLNLSEFLEEVTEEKHIQCQLLSEMIKPGISK